MSTVTAQADSYLRTRARGARDAARKKRVWLDTLRAAGALEGELSATLLTRLL